MNSQVVTVENESRISDRMQYIIGGLISVALAIGYVTLSDRDSDEVSDQVELPEAVTEGSPADGEPPAGDG